MLMRCWPVLKILSTEEREREKNVILFKSVGGGAVAAAGYRHKGFLFSGEGGRKLY